MTRFEEWACDTDVRSSCHFWLHVICNHFTVKPSLELIFLGGSLLSRKEPIHGGLALLLDIQRHWLTACECTYCSFPPSYHAFTAHQQSLLSCSKTNLHFTLGFSTRDFYYSGPNWQAGSSLWKPGGPLTDISFSTNIQFSDTTWVESVSFLCSHNIRKKNLLGGTSIKDINEANQSNRSTGKENYFCIASLPKEAYAFLSFIEKRLHFDHKDINKMQNNLGKKSSGCCLRPRISGGLSFKQ